MAATYLKFNVLLNVVYILGFFTYPSESVCNINLPSELRNRAPLLLHTGDTVLSDGTAFLLPRMTSETTALHSDEEVELLCPGPNNSFTLSGELRNIKRIEGRCVSGSSFDVDHQSYSLSDIKCTQEPESSLKNAGTCVGSNKRIQIGFSKNQNSFLNLIDICFNENLLIPSYLNYTLAEGIERRQMAEELDNPDKTDYFNTLPNSPQSYYSCSHQEEAVGSILGSQSHARQKIICSENSNFLVKTYLAASSDFVYLPQQMSTRYYINAVPMWLSIANGNWEKLEEEVRLYASNTSRDSSDLVIYTGALGVITLPDHRRVLQPIYLANEKLPVPQWVWKLVYEPQVKEGIVFILVNNPYNLKFAGCRCVCPQTKWTLGWNRQDRSKGYIYCCTVDNFRNVFPGLPQLEVTGLLKKNRPYNPFGINVEAQK